MKNVINNTNVFLVQGPKAIETTEKNKQTGPNQTYKLLHSKGNHNQNEKTTYRMGENICKWCNEQGLKFLKYTTSAYNLTTTKNTT